jgi:hypothetical protein
MTDLLFLTAFLIPFAMWGAYAHAARRPVLRVSVSAIVFLGYIGANHLGLAWLYFSDKGHFSITTFDPAVLTQLAVYSWIVTGAFILADVTGGAPRRALATSHERVVPSKGTVWWIMFVAALCLPLALGKALSDSPLMLLLEGDPIAANLARVEGVSAGSFFLGIKPQYLQIPFTVLQYGSVYLLTIALIKRQGRWLGLWAVAVVIFSLDSFSALSKGFVLIPILSVWMAWALIREKGRLLTARMLPFFIGATFAVAVFAAWVLGQAEASIFFPLERIVLGNLIPQYYVVASFNGESALLGTTIPQWMSFGLHKQFLLDVFAWRGLMGGTEDLFYTAPSSFVAEGYANFHDLGVLVFSFVAFQGVAWIDRIIVSVRGDLTYCALLVFSCIHLSRLSRSGLVNFLVDYHYWGVLIFALIGARLVFVVRRPSPIVSGRFSAVDID